MNPSLLKGVLLILLTAGILIPNRSISQCLCEGGEAPNTIVHTASLDSVTLTTSMPLPKFPTATGTLVCVNLQSTITSVMSFDLLNKVSEEFEYNMQSNLTATVSGPGGLSVNANSSDSYGPFLLGPYQGGADHVHYGPDTLFNNVNRQRTVSNVTAYTGTGNVNLMFDLSGPVWAAPSSGNYDLGVKTYSNIDVTLTYLWCENSVLSKSFKSFSASKRDNVVDLEWSVAEEKKSNKYEIQISYNGHDFQNIGERNSNAAEGTAAKYLYQYHIDKSPYRKAYFRIRQSTTGITAYSVVRVVDLEQGNALAASIYPNPVLRNINLNFIDPVNGDFVVQLTNQVGQVVYTGKARVTNSKTLQVALSQPPPPGVYYLRAREMATSKAFTSKLLFQN